ncbi:MAG TPA: tetratricopeptide repeat protein, partial [Myxococcales bacterium]|nr:tetratricopeptide repeat protein [Myxococcales bacterium]
AASLETHRALQQRALAAADKAVAAGPELADGYAARGWLRLRAQWDWPGAEADLKHAFALAPGNARILLEYGALLATLGRYPEAIAMEEKAVALDPLEVEAWSYLGSYYYAHGEKERARATWSRALEISPGHLFAVREMAFLLLLEGKPQQALALFRQTTPDWSKLSGEALAQHALGHRDLSQAALDRLTAQLGDVTAIQIAEVHAFRGEKDAAFNWLERALQSRDTGLARIKYRMLLGSLHADPRFDAFLRKLNLPTG